MRFKVEAVLGKELTRRLVVVVVRDAPRVPSARLLEPERRTLLVAISPCVITLTFNTTVIQEKVSLQRKNMASM